MNNVYFGVNLESDYVNIWKSGMKNWENEMPKRMIDDKLEEKFWNAFMEKGKHKEKKKPFVEDIVREVLMHVKSSDTVAEIGPGWGTYTFPIAQRAKALTCVDSSAAMISYLKERAEKEQLNNMNFIHGKWEEKRLDQNYDVVFGFNCFYRTHDIDKALLKMNNTASRLAIVGMTSGPEQRHYREIEKKLGYTIRYVRRDYIILQNVLYQLGIDANCQLIDLANTYCFNTYEEAFSFLTSKIVTEERDEMKLASIIDKYLEEKDGHIYYVHPFKAALLYWKPEPLF
ncbi:class I SAM-dependent methyltransferase [Priestia filamentosa]